VIELRLFAASRARLPMPVSGTAMRIAFLDGRVAAIGVEATVAAGRDGLPARVCLMPKVRAHLADRLCAGLQPWERIIVAQLHSMEAAGECGLYVLVHGADARTAVKRLWEIGGTRSISGEAQRRFGLDASWYAVRMIPGAVSACIAARGIAHDVLQQVRIAGVRAGPAGVCRPDRI
jgi:hypothetical protein